MKNFEVRIINADNELRMEIIDWDESKISEITPDILKDSNILSIGWMAKYIINKIQKDFFKIIQS